MGEAWHHNHHAFPTSAFHGLRWWERLADPTGWLIGGGLGAALTALLWGGFVRVFLLHHVTWSINSVCHFFGRKRFEVEDESRNVFWLAPFSMGEAWHHNHHAFPTSAFHGLRLWERIADPTGLVIALLEKLGLVIPFVVGWVVGGTLWAAIVGLLWGGFVRIFLLHHVTWSINSVCHFFGRKRFDVEDESRNVFWLAPFSMGEAWHHNHHAFPTSAFHGLTWSERLADPTGWIIALLEKLGVIWNVVRISPERQAAKLIAPSKSAAATAPGARNVPA
jgi:fatty-acid desaturase